MGIFSVPITVTNPVTGVSVALDALVDTGAALTVVPSSLLQQIGVAPIRRQVFELADGRRVEWSVGEVRVTVQGLTTPSLAVFDPEDVSPTLGVVVLESVGLTIDPAPPGRLIPTEGLLL